MSGAAISRRVAVERPDGASLDVLHTSCNSPRATCLLFNGAFSNLQVWSTVAATLINAGCSVVQWDVRGVGASTAAPKASRGSEQFSFENYADDARAVLDALGIERALVCGAAWGSRAALVFATQHPDRTEACVLMDFSVGNSTTSEWRVAQSVGVQLALRKLRALGELEEDGHALQLLQHATHASQAVPRKPAAVLRSISKGRRVCI